MNAVQQLTQQGHSFLRSKAGELITVRGFQLLGIIDRSPEPSDSDQGSINFEASQISKIEVSSDDLGFKPIVGDPIIDEFGNVHRVQSIENRGVTWILTCRVTTP